MATTMWFDDTKATIVGEEQDGRSSKTDDRLLGQKATTSITARSVSQRRARSAASPLSNAMEKMCGWAQVCAESFAIQVRDPRLMTRIPGHVRNYWTRFTAKAGRPQVLSANLHVSENAVG